MALYDRDYIRREHEKRGSSAQHGASELSNFAYGLIGLAVVALIYLVVIFLPAGLFSFSSVEPSAGTARHERLSKISPININSASYNDLRLLPGVSHDTAEGIISTRPFDSVERLDDVFGIGQKKLELIRPHVTVE